MNILSIINEITSSHKKQKCLELPKYDFLERSYFNEEQKKILKYAMKKELPIESLLDPNYSVELLQLLVSGLEKNIDLTKYIKIKDYNLHQLKEIMFGIANNIEYEIYAWNEYSADHMKYIRLGLEKDIDVSLYTDPLMDINLVEEIYNKKCKEV